MNTGINIGHEAGVVENVAEAIVSILAACKDREEVVAALSAFEKATSITNTTISGCSIGDRDVWDLDSTDLEDDAT